MVYTSGNNMVFYNTKYFIDTEKKVKNLAPMFSWPNYLLTLDKFTTHTKNIYAMSSMSIDFFDFVK